MSLVTGVDVSHWQTPSAQLANQRAAFGDRFAVIKSTDGLYLDPAAGRHLANFAAAGLACGSYIFYRSSKDPAAQARKLIEAAAPFHLPFGLWLDYEGGSGADRPDDLLTFLATLDDGYDGTVGLYTGPSWWQQTIGNDARFERFPLWLAQYPNRYKDASIYPQTITPTVPAPWSQVSIWQFSDGAGNLDRNVCTADTSAALTGTHPTPPPTPEEDMTPAQEAKIDALAASVKVLTKQVAELHHEYAAPIDDHKQGPHGNKAWQIAKTFLAATGRKD